MAAMAELYGRELSGPLLDAYWLSLRDWPLEDFERAAAHLMATEQHMPRPAAFTALRKHTGLTAGDAWTQVLDHCRFGTYRDGSGLDDGGPIDRAVGSIGGYQAIAMHSTEWMHQIEKRFAERLGEQEQASDSRAALGTDTVAMLESPK